MNYGVVSSDEARGFHLYATDGTIGYVNDFLLEESRLAVRYVVVDTSNWIGGQCVSSHPR